jgi:hypothetical protein
MHTPDRPNSVADPGSRTTRPDENTIRCTILVPEPPYPDTHGGRADRWSRLRGLRLRGVHVQVVVWTDGKRALSREGRDALESIGCVVCGVARVRRARAYFVGGRPGRLDSFLPGRVALDQLLASVGDFDPDLILADGLDVSLPAQRLARAVGRPLVYRSHNVEHVYWRLQSRLAHGRDRLPFLLAAPGLRGAEIVLRSQADLVLDISDEDRDWWVTTGHPGQSRVMPPLWLDAPPDELDAHEPVLDISFTGGLSAPNNVDGLEWFCSSVLPHAERAVGRRLKLAFAGSAPSKKLFALCTRFSVGCVPDPKDLTPIRLASRVLVNPVRASSGVNIKMLGMLASGRPIVSTSAGARGLPAALRAEVAERDDPVEFAGAVADAIRRPVQSSIARREALLAQVCGLPSLDPIFDLVRERRSTG